MNLSIVLFLGLVAFAAAFEVPFYHHLGVGQGVGHHVPVHGDLEQGTDYYNHDVTVSKSYAVGQYPYHHEYHQYPYQHDYHQYAYQQYPYGRYTHPYHRVFYGQYYGYPQHYGQHDYDYVHPHYGVHYAQHYGYPYHYGGHQTPAHVYYGGHQQPQVVY